MIVTLSVCPLICSLLFVTIIFLTNDFHFSISVDLEIQSLHGLGTFRDD